VKPGDAELVKLVRLGGAELLKPGGAELVKPVGAEVGVEVPVGAKVG